MRLSVVIPALDEEGSLPAVLAEVRAAEAGAEVIVIDDASTDRTGGIARDAGAVVILLTAYQIKT